MGTRLLTNMAKCISMSPCLQFRYQHLVPVSGIMSKTLSSHVSSLKEVYYRPGKTPIKIHQVENEHFHKYLDNSTRYQDYILSTPSFETDSSIKNSLCQKLLEICKIVESKSDDEKFNILFDKDCQNVLKEFGRSLHALPDTELFDSLRLLPLFKFRLGLTEEISYLRYSLAMACNQRFLQSTLDWNIKQWLLAADIFYVLRYTSFKLTFIDNMFKKLQRNESDLSVEEIVITLYLANLHRRCPPSLLYNLTGRVENYLHVCSPDDVGIICLGNFKCKHLKAKSFHFSVTDYLMKNIETMNHLSMASIVKYLTSAPYDSYINKFHVERIESLMNVINKKPIKTNNDIISFLHVYSMFDQWKYINSDLIENLKLLIRTSNLSEWRLKELAKVSMMLGNMSNIIEDVEDVLMYIVKEMTSPNRKEEINKTLHMICLALDGVTRAGLYPEQLFNYVFCETGSAYFKNVIHKGNNYKRSLGNLLERMKVESPHMFQNIPSNYVSLYCEINLIQEEKQTLSVVITILFEEIQSILKSILGGEQYFRYCKKLINQPKDIEIWFDNNGKPIEVNQWENFNEKSCTKVLIILQVSKDFYRIINKDLTVVYKRNGYSDMKIRQLKKLGYIPVPIANFFFRNAKNQVEYVKDEINQAIGTDVLI